MKIPERSDYLLFGGVFVLANKMQSTADKLVEGLSVKQWFLLRTILDMPAPSPTITQIAEETYSTRQNVTKVLENMERGGLVVIEENEADRRSRRVRITEAGLSQVKFTAANAQGFLARMIDGITPGELQAAGQVIIKMMQNLQSMQEEST